MELILDAHNDIVSSGTVMEDFDGFFAIIDSIEQFPMVNRKSVLIRPGHNNFVAIEATKTNVLPFLDSVAPRPKFTMLAREGAQEGLGGGSQIN